MFFSKTLFLNTKYLNYLYISYFIIFAIINIYTNYTIIYLI